MQLVLNTHGLLLKVKNKVFYVTAGDESRLISPEKISSIAVTAPCLISSAAIQLAADAGISIYFYDRIGDAQSCLRSPYFESLATLRRKQVYFSDAVAGSTWVIEQFRYKTEHQIQVLNYLRDRRSKHQAAIQQCIQTLSDGLEKLVAQTEAPSGTWSAALMGWEGHQAKVYWQQISECLPETWRFAGRSRRPAKDAFNAMLNYLYGMLYTVVEQALFAAGLDPHLGILHTDEYDRPTLAYDLIEPFRPWVDLFIIQRLLKKEIEPTFFEPYEEGLYLSDNGKRFLIPAFNGWMLERKRWQSRQLSREAHIYQHAAQLAKTIHQSVERPR
ncbi:MAG: CRISPR-associated endonuclease Cas1 [Phaeodactylibacter sp.]|nr:CRISPR-associated endonuclease Cas1 [Phaeodactylibacter sp.]